MHFEPLAHLWRKPALSERPVSPELERRVQFEQIALLYRNSTVGYIVTILTGALLVFALSDQISRTHLYSWYSCLFAVTAVRYYLTRTYLRSSLEQQKSAKWEKLFVLGAGSAGLTWGLSFIVLYPANSVPHQFFIGLTLAGLVGGSVAVFSARKTAYMAFSLAILIPIILRFLYEDDAIHSVLAVMVFIYLSAMSMTAKNTERAIKIALMLRFDNQALNDQIEKRRVTEEALRESEARFRDFTASAADFFWELDQNYQFTDVSERFEELTGIHRDEVLGRSSIEIFNHCCDETEALGKLLHDIQQQRDFEKLELDWRQSEQPKRNLLFSARPIFDDGGDFKGFRGVGRDVTEERRIAQLIKHQATHDELTGLVNRREFMRRLENAVEQSKHGGFSYTLCYIDLDQFKIVNDTVGHAAGDELLKEFSGLMHGRIRTRDTLSRVGGDEFALLLENCQLKAGVQVAETLLATLSEYRFKWESKEFQIGASIGLLPITSDKETALQVLSQVDLACYTAKRLGRNRLYVYQEDDRELNRIQQQMELVSTLQDALRDNRFQLYSQPICSLLHSRGENFELLLRLEESPGKLIMPSDFIPVAERYGMMQEVDRWVIHNALSNYANNYGYSSGVTYSVNLSGNSLNDETLLEWILGEFNQSKVAPESLCFEITETAAISNLNRASELIRELKQRGCRFALDDFGSGHSSFAYIKYLPVDYLKIDGGFVREMGQDETAGAMVAAINEMGHVLGIKTVAEHVESNETLKVLRGIAVDYVQGFVLSEPLPINQGGDHCVSVPGLLH